ATDIMGARGGSMIYRYPTGIIVSLGLLLVGLGMLRDQAGAADPPTTPMLRLETGMHLAVINRIGVDAAQRYLVTGSDDKTVGVWELASGRLLRTLRPPIGAGDEGKIYAVALSPDGRTVAAGGFTDPGGTEQSLYLFD